MPHTIMNCPHRGKRNPKTNSLVCPKCKMKEYWYDQTCKLEEYRYEQSLKSKGFQNNQTIKDEGKGV